MDKLEFVNILHVIFERYLPDNGNSLKIGNVTFTNDNGYIVQDIPTKFWDIGLIADDVLKLLRPHDTKD